jgi:hypothetical protein
VDVPLAAHPDITLDKTGHSGDGGSEGDQITFEFTVTNTGNVTLRGVNVTDPMPGLSALSYDWPAQRGVLASGASVKATAKYTITAADVDAGKVHNVATAGGTPPAVPGHESPDPVTDDDSATVKIIDNDSIASTGFGARMIVAVGGLVLAVGAGLLLVVRRRKGGHA